MCSLIEVNHDHPNITILSLNRPEKRNALSIELCMSLRAAIEETVKKNSQRVLILKGNGPAFCAGLDLEELLNKNLDEESSHLIADVLTQLYHCPLVTIAAIHGAAIGGGGGLMSACDFVVAAQNTKIGFPEVHRGLVAAQIMPILMRQVRLRDLRELLILGNLITPEKAAAIGLINEVVPQDQLLEKALKIAKQVLKGAPCAIFDTKLLLEKLHPNEFDKDLQEAVIFHKKARQSLEAEAGVQAFLEKREPIWDQAYHGSH